LENIVSLDSWSIPDHHARGYAMGWIDQREKRGKKTRR
jgi:hypothetical protein